MLIRLGKCIFVVASMAALQIVSTAWGAGIDTSRQFFIQGVLRDTLGRPISDVRIDDGTQATFTGSDGRYELEERGPGTYVIEATSDRTFYAATRVSVISPPVAFATVANFTLRYALSATWQDEPTERAVTIASSAPKPGSPGQLGGFSCIYASEVGGSTSKAASYTGLSDAGGAALWDVRFPLTVARIAIWAKDCSTGTVLSYSGSTLSFEQSSTSPPGEASAFTNQRAPSITFSVDDQGGSGVKWDSLRVFVDRISIPVAVSVPNFYAQARWLSDGEHSVEIVVSDYAGNVARLVYPLTVEQQAPILFEESPMGTIETSTPLISVKASDDTSGVDVDYVQLVLEDGLLANHLSADYDPATGTISYQVPSTSAGDGLGEGPLLDGQYTMTAVVVDVAGNRQIKTWSFVVDALL